jgi:aldose 1-epimerase
MLEPVEIFGHLPDGREVELITLKSYGLQIKLLTWGATLQDLRFANFPYSLTQGPPDPESFLTSMPYHGPIIGPVVNRISGAQAAIWGRLAVNQQPDICLHSGDTGTHMQLWSLQEATCSHAVLTLDLPDGLGGFPGNRHIVARFELCEGACLRLSITAKSDAPTLFNFANHSYWNLDGSDSFAGHSMQISASHYLPTDHQVVPTVGSDYDFTKMRALTPRSPNFDTNFCLSTEQKPLRQVMELKGSSGLAMRLSTTQTGLQIYDARDAERPYSALVIEAQSWPDAPNNPKFPTILYAADQAYHEVTEWQFSA